VFSGPLLSLLIFACLKSFCLLCDANPAVFLPVSYSLSDQLPAELLLLLSPYYPACHPHPSRVWGTIGEASRPKEQPVQQLAAVKRTYIYFLHVSGVWLYHHMRCELGRKFRTANRAQ
jgi:hypothetical protein